MPRMSRRTFSGVFGAGLAGVMSWDARGRAAAREGVHQDPVELTTPRSPIIITGGSTLLFASFAIDPRPNGKEFVYELDVEPRHGIDILRYQRGKMNEQVVEYIEDIGPLDQDRTLQLYRGNDPVLTLTLTDRTLHLRLFKKLSVVKGQPKKRRTLHTMPTRFNRYIFTTGSTPQNHDVTNAMFFVSPLS